MLIRYLIPTPIGRMEIAGSELGIQSVKLCQNQKQPVEIGVQDDAVLLAEHPVAACARQLTEYFAGAREVFDLKLDWGGAPEFHRQVWGELLKIPFGKTTTYSAIAEQLNNPAAVRAVGMANRSNPIAIIVPCHRVIGKAGELRGYFYGLDTKMMLLRHENPQRFAEQGALF
ncbi:MAG TPA: cysteine methyltransferase [Saprospirales bacterium]|nr:cysteine methyltransferase [Saprospirales bacterium]